MLSEKEFDHHISFYDSDFGIVLLDSVKATIYVNLIGIAQFSEDAASHDRASTSLAMNVDRGIPWESRINGSIHGFLLNFNKRYVVSTFHMTVVKFRWISNIVN